MSTTNQMDLALRHVCGREAVKHSSLSKVHDDARGRARTEREYHSLTMKCNGFLHGQTCIHLRQNRKATPGHTNTIQHNTNAHDYHGRPPGCNRHGGRAETLDTTAAQLPHERNSMQIQDARSMNCARVRPTGVRGKKREPKDAQEQHSRLVRICAVVVGGDTHKKTQEGTGLKVSVQGKKSFPTSAPPAHS